MRYLFQPMTENQVAAWREDALYAQQQAGRLGTTLLMRRLYTGSAMLWLTDTLKSMLTFDTTPDYMGEFLDIIYQWQKALLQQVLDIVPVDIVTRFRLLRYDRFLGQEILRPLPEADYGC